jgi:hypothetical protein
VKCSKCGLLLTHPHHLLWLRDTGRISDAKYQLITSGQGPTFNIVNSRRMG